MTMFKLEAVTQAVNELFHRNFAPGEIGVQSDKLPISEPVISAETMESLMPNTFVQPGFEAASNYYFLSHLVAQSQHEPVQLITRPASFPVESIRKDFPILQQRINGHPLIWFDNAATTQKPSAVIDTLQQYYREINSNVHRGAHTLAKRATNAYEAAREKVQHLINASSAAEIIFVRGTTEAINLVAQTFGKMHLGKGDEILVSAMEHHSNIVPWQLVCQQTGAIMRVIPIHEQGDIILGEYEKLLSRRVRLVAIAHVSNVLGTVNPVKSITEMAHYYGAKVLVDGAQAVPHFKVDLHELNADFYAFSGHKFYGPTGIGILYGKKSLLEEVPPWQGGGGMIQRVSFDETTYNSLPHKFEAGTGNIADAVGLGAAVDYLCKMNLNHLEGYEREITEYAMNTLRKINGIRIFGTSPNKISVISFLIQGISSEELARLLDQHGIAIRVGHHCAQPLMQHYGVKEMLRVSLGIYNTKAEIDKLVEVIQFFKNKIR